MIAVRTKSLWLRFWCERAKHLNMRQIAVPDRPGLPPRVNDDRDGDAGGAPARPDPELPLHLPPSAWRCVSPSRNPVRESDVLGLKHRRAFERLLGAGSGLTTPRDRTRVLSCSAPPGQSTLASAWIGLPARTLAASAPAFRFGSTPSAPRCKSALACR